MKSIKILMIIIIILVIVLGLKISGVTSKVDQINEKELKELLIKGISYDNIYTSYEMQDGQKNEKFLKGNILVVSNESIYTWQNLETNEKIMIKDGNALVQKKSTSLPDIDNFSMKNYIENSSKYKIIYEKSEVFQNKKCVVINVIYNETSQIIERIWLDLETGLPLKTSISEKYSYSIGTVKDSDVKKPDLSQYKVINLN